MDNNITDLFFDLDHTLWDFDTNSTLAFTKVLQDYNIPIHLDDFLSVFRPIDKAYWDDYSYNKVSVEQLKLGRFYDTFKLLSTSFNKIEIEMFANSYMQELIENNLLFEDAIPTLEYLHTKYRMHIITNGFTAEQAVKINRSGLTNFFKTVTTSDELGIKKPDPEIFNHAMNKAKTQAIKAVMIGDNYDADILGAENVGMNVVHYDYHKQEIPDKYKQIKTLSELKELL